MRRVAAACAVLAWLWMPFASRADDSANQACSDGQGVTLVVDFQSLGGGVNVRCAAQPINNGYDVFRHANVAYTTVNNNDFVCTIAEEPSKADCSHYPPANYYWSYWWAQPGQDWQYASLGAGAHHPPPGAYEGWSFVNSDKSTPPRYPVPPAPTTTTTAATAAPPTSSAAAADASPPPASHARAPAGTAVPTPPTSATSAAVLVPVAPANSSTTSSSVPLGHMNLAERGQRHGSARGFVVGGVAVALAGGMAVALARGRGR